MESSQSGCQLITRSLPNFVVKMLSKMPWKLLSRLLKAIVWCLMTLVAFQYDITLIFSPFFSGLFCVLMQPSLLSLPCSLSL